jgi:hypothetical protein
MQLRVTLSAATERSTLVDQQNEPSKSTISEPVRPSAAAQRMRRHRQRVHKGLRCLVIELRETEVDTLVRQGLLQAEMRNDKRAVRKGLYAFLDRALGAAP